MTSRDSLMRPQGFVDNIEGTHMSGWAMAAVSDVPISLIENGTVLVSTTTRMRRDDLGCNAGFEIEAGIADLSLKLLERRVVLMAGKGIQSRELPLTDGLRDRLLVHSVLQRLPALAAAQVNEMLQGIQVHLLGENRDYGSYRLLPTAPPGEMSAVIAPVGQLSFDGEAVVGRDGQIFLVRGTNELDRQYGTPDSDPDAVEIAGGWLRLIKERKSLIEDRGARFHQCIIPEKSSVLNDAFPAPIPNGTAIMRNMRHELAADPEAWPFISDCMALLSSADVRAEAFQPIDTHLAPRGAEAIASGLVLALQLPPMDRLAMVNRLHLGGDVGRRILGPHARAALAAPCASETAAIDSRLEVIAHDVAPHMIGTRIVYRNPDAINATMKVVAFANSFFNLGSDASHVSWWFARMFGEYHFVWSPECDLAYVEATQPNIVICQTIERFLSKLPSR